MSLELRDIDFAYAPRTARILNSFSMSIADGEAVALMAPSGAGKSTILGIAGLLLRPQAGTVVIDGHPRTTRDAQKMLGTTVSFVLQSVNLLPRRTVIDNITLPAMIAGGRRRAAERRAAKLAEELGLSELLNRPARTLSGGQAQRVGIARALITEPRIIIADEPTANLDLTTAREVSALLLGTQRGSTCVLLATHDISIAKGADRIVDLSTVHA